MSVYALVRSVYRSADRAVLRHLPGQDQMRAGLWHIARRLFPGRMADRYADQYAASARGRAAMPRHVPEWAAAEIATLAKYEPLLAKLVGRDAVVEPYCIPFGMNYVGKRYAAARRALRGPYACMVLSGAGAHAVDMVMLGAARRPLAIIDVAGDARLASLARAAGADYVALPAQELDANDHCAVLARLVLQLAPTSVLPTPDPVVARCLERHGRALASVTKVSPLLAAAGQGVSTRKGAPP